MALIALLALLQPGGRPADAAISSGFVDRIVLTGMSNPIDVEFAPDGRVFVAQKNGVIKVFSSISDASPRVFADLSSEVDDYWDRGLIGLALDPHFTTGRPYVYALYTYDAPPGGTSPTWNDACPSPPGPTTNGCVVTGRLVKLTDAGSVSVARQVLVTDWCQQFPSHTMDTIKFGNDGALYASAGEGGSFNYADWGQTGNACADPPSAKGTNLAPPTAEGGALRAQSVRRTDGPTVLNGSIIRIDPDTGAGLPTNPFAARADVDAKRILAYGLRNPFRFTFRPGTNELWAGDVGAGAWEEIDRVTDTTTGPARNFGWPCFEGAGRQPSFDAADLNLCESLYGAGGVTAPYFAYSHTGPVVANDNCANNAGASITGLAFTPGGSYPAQYRGALFFADQTRRCIYAMLAGSDGLPDRSTLRLIESRTAAVQLITGPNGDIYYPGLGDGSIHQLTYPSGSSGPLAVLTATPASGAAPLTTTLDGSGSTGTQPLSYSWDLDGDGVYGDATGPTTTTTFTTGGPHVVRLQVTDSTGASDRALTTVRVTGGTPTPVITTPLSTQSFKVGSQVAFSGSATDANGVPLPDSALTWHLVIHHCPTIDGCHTHEVQDWVGTASGSFVSPDHGYPSYLELQLEATDPATGLTGLTSVQLTPQTALLKIATVPSGLRVSVDGQSRIAPFQVRVVLGHTASVIAATPQKSGSATYDLTSWSDGGAASHSVTVTAPRQLTATYTLR